MSNDVKLEQAADEAARSALSEEWPENGYDHFERWIFKAGFLAGARYQSQQREDVLEEAAKVARDYASKARMREWITAPQSAALAASHISTNIRALKTTPAPAVSTDELVALLVDLKDRRLPDRYNSDAELSDRLDAILSRLRGEGE